MENGHSTSKNVDFDAANKGDDVEKHNLGDTTLKTTPEKRPSAPNRLPQDQGAAPRAGGLKVATSSFTQPVSDDWTMRVAKLRSD